jgi:hypothetical protein
VVTPATGRRGSVVEKVRALYFVAVGKYTNQDQVKTVVGHNPFLQTLGQTRMLLVL